MSMFTMSYKIDKLSGWVAGKGPRVRIPDRSPQGNWGQKKETPNANRGRQCGRDQKKANYCGVGGSRRWGLSQPRSLTASG